MTQSEQQDEQQATDKLETDKPEKLTDFQYFLVTAILLSAFIGIIVTGLRNANMYGAALLYIGMPTLLALGIAKSRPSKSVMGATLKAITMIILISGPLLQEGFMCMVMAAPIFYIVGALAAWPFDHYRKKKLQEGEASRLNMIVIPSLLLLMSMEGVFEQTSFNRHNTVEVSRVIDANIQQIKQRLASNRKVGTPDSLFARIFPRPDIIKANGLTIGSSQTVDITYAKWIFWNKQYGQTRFELVEHRPNYIRFAPKHDSSYISSYLTWGDTEIFFKALSKNRTRVSWRVHYTRNIDPAWYVHPLQRYSASKLAEQMLATLQ